jgi:hypothetical protein
MSKKTATADAGKQSPGGRPIRSRAKEPRRARKSTSSSKKRRAAGERLRPGELDGLVLAYLKKHKDEAPLTAGAIGRGVKRSSGAVANCLERLAKAGEVHEVTKKPRAFAPKSGSK